MLDSATILANARGLEGAVRGVSNDIEHTRRLPDPLVAQMRDAGLFRIAMPAAWGGPEMNPLDQIELIETLSRFDASVGWCTAILSDSGFYAAFLEDEVGRALYGRLDVPTAGMLAPVGRAEVAEGGYRVSGRWAFGSGSLHAEWITGGCLVTRNGVPETKASGLPVWRVVIMDPNDVEIRDTWYVTGLSGSGSNHYEAKDVFVPEAHCFDVLGKPRRPEPLYGYHGLFFANVPGIPLGLGRAAIDVLSEVAADKVVMPSMKKLADEYRVQVAMAEAEGAVSSARAYVWDVMGAVWETLCSGDPLTTEQRARVALVILEAGRAGRRAVELACEAVGSDALYAGHPLERMRRDAIAMSSHLVHQMKSYASVGRVLMGGEVGLAYF